MMQILSLHLFYTWGNRAPERLANLSKDTQLIMLQTGFEPRLLALVPTLLITLFALQAVFMLQQKVNEEVIFGGGIKLRGFFSDVSETESHVEPVWCSTDEEALTLDFRQFWAQTHCTTHQMCVLSPDTSSLPLVYHTSHPWWGHGLMVSGVYVWGP